MTIQRELLKSLALNGDKTAIEYGQKRISYASLRAASGKITRFLLGRKLEPETIVGVNLRNRADLISTVIGIINARCVFVLLDETLPPARQWAVASQLNLQYVITSRDVPQFPFAGQGTPYLLEDLLAEAGALTQEAQLPAFGEDDSLYVYFTSGSTGTPKGIVGRNGSLLQFARWETGAFGINGNTRVSQLISPFFDAFLRDVFVPLLAGGTLCIPPADEDFFTPEKLIPWIEASGVHLIHCVPSLFRVFNNGTLTPNHFAHLRYVLLSGEKIIPSELTQWYEQVGDRVQLVNLYGPTEATMIRSCYLIRPEDAKAARIPIGFPISDTELVILNADGKPCRTLETGDLYIASAYLTKGYLHNQALTAEKFVKLEAGTPREKTAFRTGDKARRLADGRVDLLGREDRQVKVRGIRVELDEIENVMGQSPLVKNAVVIAHRDETGMQTLSAFVVKGDSPPEGGDWHAALEGYLKEQLPAYMIPANLVAVSSYPLLKNGKINYQELLGQLVLTALTAPANPTEARILAIWKEILGDKPISTEDSFHRIGGNSLSIMRLIGRLYK
ncbi:MAG TPA: non-ribosomal peptide synthetase, partial [Cytophagales bacterium]